MREKTKSTKGFIHALLREMQRGDIVVSTGKIVTAHQQRLESKCGRYAVWKFPHVLQSFINGGVVELRPHPKGKRVVLSAKGERRLAQLDLRQYQWSCPKVWDRKWRIIVFDVPELTKVNRNMLRLELKRRHFYQLQRSVFVTPYPCEELCMLICAATTTARCVYLIEATTLGAAEKPARAYFRL